MQLLILLRDVLQPLLITIDDSFFDFEPLNRFASLIKVRPAYIALSLFVLTVIALGSGVLSSSFVALFGMVYPAYMTFKALAKSDVQLNKQWLMYWIVFGLFTACSGAINQVFFFFLSFRAYNVFRVLLYLLLFHPSTRGAKYIYQSTLVKRLRQLSKHTAH